MFVELYNFICNLTTNFLVDKNASFVNLLATLKNLIVIGLTTSILWTAIQTMLHNNKSPFNEILWSLFKRTIVLSIVFGSGNWIINTAPEISNEIYNWAFGGVEFVSKPAHTASEVDRLREELRMVIACIAGSRLNIFGQVIGILIVYISFLIIALAAMLFIAITKITNSILVLVLPICILSLMFAQTKDIFSQWVKLFISNILTIFICSYMTNKILILNYEDCLLEMKDKFYYNPSLITFYDCCNPLFVAIFASMIFGLGYKLAVALAGNISLDSSLNKVGGIGTGIAGAGVGAAGTMGRAGLKGLFTKNEKGRSIAGNLARDVFNAGRFSANQLGNLIKNRMK